MILRQRAFDGILKVLCTNLDLLNIVLIGGTNDIPKHDEKYEMHRLIGALLSNELKEQEKMDIIEHEHNISISKE